MNALRIKILLVLALFAITLSACAPSGALAAQLTPSPTALPAPTDVPTALPSPTSLPAAASTPVAGTTAVPIVIVPTDAAGNNVATLDNNNQQINLHVGETFLLKLGQQYDWSPVIDNQAVISRVPNISVIVGAQGIYLAHQAGSATLTATGDPPCHQTKPACMMPSLIFTLHIDVQP